LTKPSCDFLRCECERLPPDSLRCWPELRSLPRCEILRSAFRSGRGEWTKRCQTTAERHGVRLCSAVPELPISPLAGMPSRRRVSSPTSLTSMLV
jgi:hypothetical protein